ncbi:hypothetical protein V500_01520 [Pseudogymnoascus sp. VKM F-4518 (FW-2643)]|nr:hypothetical protein V500_01520 [Pseudogymnoascus sp. VKM F-4518 (FW-2643)]
MDAINGRRSDGASQGESGVQDVIPDSQGSESPRQGGFSNAFRVMEIVPSSQDSSDQSTRNGEDIDNQSHEFPRDIDNQSYNEFPRNGEDAAREPIDDQSHNEFPQTFIYRSVVVLQISLRCLGVAGRELEHTERRAVGHRAITSVRALLSYIRGGLQRPVEEYEAWERDIGGGDLIRHSMAAVWQIGMAIGVACRRADEVECRLVEVRIMRVFDDVFRELRVAFE